MREAQITKINGIRTLFTDTAVPFVAAVDFCKAIGYRSASGTANKCKSYELFTDCSGASTRKIAGISADDALALAVNKKCSETYDAWRAGLETLRKDMLSGGAPGSTAPIVPVLARDTTTAINQADTRIGQSDAPAVPEDPANVFTHSMFGEIRIVDNNGEPWFIANDVARALGYANPAKAIIDHCKGVSEVGTPSPGGMQATKIISEKDLYRLIMHSKLPSAEAFQDWVMDEVLPSIRKTGTYMTDQFIESALDDPDTAIRLLQEVKASRALTRAAEAARVAAEHARVIAEQAVARANAKLLAAETRVETAEKTVEEMAPLANIGKLFINSKVAGTFAVSARVISNAGYDITAEQLQQLFRDQGFIWKTKNSDTRNMPTEEGAARGYVVPETHLVKDSAGRVTKRRTYSHITPAGERWAYEYIQQHYAPGRVDIVTDRITAGKLSEMSLGGVTGTKLAKRNKQAALRGKQHLAAAAKVPTGTPAQPELGL